MFPPEDLKLLADRVMDAIDPDGTVPNDQLNQDRRYFHLRSTRDGAYVGDFRLTGTAGAKLKTLLDPLAKPRSIRPATVDPRTYGQRSHDALEDLCDRQLRAGDVPDAGGIPATVIVTIDADDLIHRTGTAAPATAPRSRRRNCCSWPTTPTSSPPSSPPPEPYWTSAGAGGSPAGHRRWR